MDRDRTSQPARQLQLRQKDRLLIRIVAVLDRMIDPDFADAGLRIFKQQPLQRLQPLPGPLRNKPGVQPERCKDPFV